MGAVGRAVGAALAPSQWPIYTNISPKLRTVSAIVKGSERTITRSLLPRPISPFNWDLIDASGDILVLSMDGSMLADDNKLVHDVCVQLRHIRRIVEYNTTTLS